MRPIVSELSLLCPAPLMTLLLVVPVHAGHVVTDGSLGPAQTFTGPTYQIGPQSGRLVGSNLFQSFSTFNLDKGDVATFTAPASVHNILARVTGGSASTIDGTIATRLDTNPTTPHPATFYLINPTGVIFGPDAKIDIGGSFVVSTADVIRFSDGGTFYASPAASSVLSTTAPSAFGFLTSAPSSVIVSGNASDALSGIGISGGHSLSLIAGDIQIVGGRLEAPSGGAINLVSVRAAGEVAFSSDAPISQEIIPPHLASGNVRLNSGASIAAPDGGHITIRAGNLDLSQSSIVINNSVTGGGLVDVRSGGVLSLEDARIGSDSSGGVAAADIRITAKKIAIHGAFAGDGGAISSDTYGTGSGGMVMIQGDSLSLAAGGFLATRTFAAGDGGNLSVDVATLSLRGVEQSGRALSPPGVAPIPPLTGLFSSSELTTAAETGAIGNAGSIDVVANRINARGDARLAITADGAGAVGNLSVRASQISLGSGSSAIVRAIDANGGNLSLRATDSLQLLDANAESESNTGDLSLVSGKLLRLGHSNVIVRGTSTDGAGGAISFDAALLVVFNSTIDGRSNGQSLPLTVSPRAILLSSQSHLLSAKLPFNEVASSAGELAIVPFDVKPLLAQCATVSEDGSSTFVASDRGGSPAEPGGWVPDLDLRQSRPSSQPQN